MSFSPAITATTPASGIGEQNTLFERSCRAPLIITAPGMKGGPSTCSLAEFVAVYPTAADFCGLKMPHTAAGASLRPVLADPIACIKDAAFTLVTRGDKLHGQSIRTARWRFTRWSDGQTELYDHETDSEELHARAQFLRDVDRSRATPQFLIGRAVSKTARLTHMAGWTFHNGLNHLNEGEKRVNRVFDYW